MKQVFNLFFHESFIRFPSLRVVNGRLLGVFSACEREESSLTAFLLIKKFRLMGVETENYLR